MKQTIKNLLNKWKKDDSKRKVKHLNYDDYQEWVRFKLLSIRKPCLCMRSAPQPIKQQVVLQPTCPSFIALRPLSAMV